MEFTEIISERPDQWWLKNQKCVIFFAFPLPREPERLIVEKPRRKPVLVHSKELHEVGRKKD